jgi:molecular chaperone GrpE (heat shock protein)
MEEPVVDQVGAPSQVGSEPSEDAQSSSGAALAESAPLEAAEAGSIAGSPAEGSSPEEEAPADPSEVYRIALARYLEDNAPGALSIVAEALAREGLEDKIRDKLERLQRRAKGHIKKETTRIKRLKVRADAGDASAADALQAAEATQPPATTEEQGAEAGQPDAAAAQAEDVPTPTDDAPAVATDADAAAADAIEGSEPEAGTPEASEDSEAGTPEASEDSEAGTLEASTPEASEDSEAGTLEASTPEASVDPEAGTLEASQDSQASESSAAEAADTEVEESGTAAAESSAPEASGEGETDSSQAGSGPALGITDEPSDPPASGREQTPRSGQRRSGDSQRASAISDRNPAVRPRRKPGSRPPGPGGGSRVRQPRRGPPSGVGASSAGVGRELDRIRVELESLGKVVGGVENHTMKVAEAYQRISRAHKRKEQAYDQLYEELRSYKDNFLLSAQKPLFKDIILLFDGVRRTARSIKEKEEAPTKEEILQALEHLQDEILEVLYRKDIELIEEHPDVLDIDFQKPVRRVETDDPAEDRKIEQVVREGFRMNDVVLRPQEVVVKRCLKERES